MYQIAGAAQMKELDRQAIEEYGVSSLGLMERAARAGAEEVRGLLEGGGPDFIGGAASVAVLGAGAETEEDRRELEALQALAEEKNQDHAPWVGVLCGPGNNGGDGVAAAVVECREGWPSIGAVLGSRGDDVLLRLPGLGRGEPNVLSMEGTQVFKFAVETVSACMDATLKKAGLTPADIDFFVFHQANARIIDLAVRKYRIPPEKYYKNIDHYGNTAAASVPLVLSELYEQGRIGPGSRLLTVAFGGGLTWGGAVLELA